MQYCPKCKININGYKKACPLCQGKLKGEPEYPIFPIQKKHVSRVSIIRIMTFIFAVFEIVMISLHYLLRHEIGADDGWMKFVMLIGFIAWADIVMVIILRNNILKVVTYEIYILMLYTLGIDYFTGKHGWSISWTLPCMFIFIGIFTLIAGKITKAEIEDYVYYLVFDIVLSQLQWIPIIREMNKFTWPAIISVTFYLIMAAAILVFKTRELKNASAKMWNV